MPVTGSSGASSGAWTDPRPRYSPSCRPTAAPRPSPSGPRSVGQWPHSDRQRARAGRSGRTTRVGHQSKTGSPVARRSQRVGAPNRSTPRRAKRRATACWCAASTLTTHPGRHAPPANTKKPWRQKGQERRPSGHRGHGSGGEADWAALAIERDNRHAGRVLAERLDKLRRLHVNPSDFVPRLATDGLICRQYSNGVLDGWPSADALIAAYQKLAMLR
jgi:hypothetical protein